MRVAAVCDHSAAPLHLLPHQNLERAKRKGLWEKLSRGCLPASGFEAVGRKEGLALECEEK